MKNLLLLFPFLFLFFQKINCQVEPRLVEKLTEEYSGSLYNWVDKTREIYKYDFRGNRIEYAKITYNILGDIEMWDGIRYEYDVNDLLQKETVGRYNWEVGIWINEYWIDYFYDENGCVEKRHRLYNLDLLYWVEIVQTDGNCLEMEYTQYNSNPEGDVLSYVGEVKYEYDERDNEIYSLRRNKYSFGIDEEIIISEVSEQGFNDQNDRTFLRRYAVDTLGVRTSPDDSYLYNYEYQFDLNNRVERKNITRYRYNPPEITDTLAKGMKEIFYEYSCDGLVVKEETLDSRYVILGDTLHVHQRCFYKYEGVDNCFNNENKLTATIYPNPTTSNFSIESPLFESGNVQVRLFDMNGRLVLEELIFSREEKQSFNISDLVNGTYVIQLLNGEFFVSKKLVVVK